MNAALNGSVIKVIPAITPAVAAAAASGAASNFAGYEFGTVIVIAGSAGSGAGYVVNLERSATSDGTFAQFGASVPGTGTNGTAAVRSFAINSSATWHKISSDNNNGGSVNVAAVILLHRGRYEPVATQDTRVTTYSDIVRG